MTSDGNKVQGRSFQYKKDYMDALDDKKQIDQIKEKFHMQDITSLTLLVHEIEKEKYDFKTLVGEDFIDEVYEQYDRLKRTKKVELNDPKKRIKKKKKEKKIAIEDFDDQMQEQIIAEIKRKDRKRRIFLFVCILVAVGSLSYFFIYDYMEKRTTSDVEDWAALKKQGDDLLIEKEFEFVPNLTTEEVKVEDLQVLEEYEILIEKNKTLIGWIKIDDTYIDYPVMQAADNEYYLSNNFNQEKDNNGCIFLDYQSDYINRDTNLILYGHNMRSGRMFGDLRNYEDEAYYQEHAIIQFDTIYEKGTYEIMYVFHGTIYKEEDIAFKYYQFLDAESKVEFAYYMDSMEEIALYDTGVNAVYGDQLLTLSTCDGSDDTKRFVVVAKRIQ